MKSSSPSHHKVPQVYLKGFDFGRGIIVYDFSKGVDLDDLVRQVENPTIETNVKKLAAEINYYTRETAGGPDFSFEEMLARFENQYRPTMKMIRSGAPLSDKQLGMLGLLAAVQDARVNRMSFVKPMSEIRDHAKALYEQHRPGMTEDEITSETDAMFRREMVDMEIPSPRNIALAAVPQMMTFSFTMFRYMHKCILESGAQDFVTSDAPVVWVDPAQFPQPQWKFYRLSGFMEVTFPLSRRYCLLMAWHPMVGRFAADEAMVGTINARTSTYARQRVFATNRDDIHQRHTNGRDFTTLRRWVGMPISSALLDEKATLSADDAARYQLCLRDLGIEWDEARAENAELVPRFEQAAQFFLDLQAADATRD